MHIAFLTTEYPHKNLSPAGGIGTFIGNMARAFTEGGHQVTIFLCLSERDTSWSDNQVQIIEIARASGKYIPEFITSRLKINKVVRRYIAQNNIDLIEAPDWEGLHAFCRVSIPLLTRTHGSVTYFSKLANRPSPRAITFLEKRGLKKSDHIVGVTKYAAAQTKKLFKLQARELRVIYYGTDLIKFKPLPKEHIKTPPILLHFGTLVRKKGVLDLPHIFNEIHQLYPDFELVILGKDTIDSVQKESTWSLMKEIFEKNTLSKVRYLGPVSLDTVKEHLAQATACIFTSYAETFGLVTTEAMAMAKPVIIYDFPWVREIIDHREDGILIQPGDFKKCAQTITEIVNDQETMQLMGAKARQKVEERFDLEKIFQENLTFYKSVLDGQ